MENGNWQWIDHPGRLLAERGLGECLRGTDRALICRDGAGFILAFPYVPSAPFPIPPLFCLCRLDSLRGRYWLLFRFSDRGRPELFS